MKLNYILAFAVLLLLAGCTTEIFTFEQGVSEMEKIDGKYGADFKSMPGVMDNAVLMRRDLKELEGRSFSAPESFKLFLDYRIKSLEANIINLEAWKHGRKSTTVYGFGCKSLGIVVNSSRLRNYSAQKGYDSLEVLKEFVDQYGEEALSINITQRDIVFSNVYYYKLEDEASKDKRIIEHFCIKDEKEQ